MTPRIIRPSYTHSRSAFEFVTLSDMIHVVWHYGDPWKVKEAKERGGGGVESRVNACKNVCLELPTRNILGNKFKHGNPKTFKMIPLGRHRHHTATRITSTRVEWMILCHSQAIPPWLSVCTRGGPSMRKWGRRRICKLRWLRLVLLLTHFWQLFLLINWGNTISSNSGEEI